MNVEFSALEFESATATAAEAYDRWFSSQVREAIDDPRPGIAHYQTMARVRAIIAAKREEKRLNNDS